MSQYSLRGKQTRHHQAQGVIIGGKILKYMLYPSAGFLQRIAVARLVLVAFTGWTIAQERCW